MGIFSSLSARITLALAIGLTGVLLISGGFADNIISQEIRAIVSHEKEASMILQAENVALPLWNLDKDHLQHIIDNIAQDQEVVFANITDASDGNSIVSAGQMRQGKSGSFSILSQDIIYKNRDQVEKLGTLSIALDYSAIDKKVATLMHQVAIVAGSLLVFVIAAIYLITWLMVRPVTQLSSQLVDVAREEGVTISTKHISSTVNEVQQLLKALNRLQCAQAVYQEKLINSKNEAEEASQAKSEFLANMSHELRTPLNSIIGITKMLRDDSEMDSEEREMTSIVYKSGINLLDIVNDILDLSKIESKHMELEHKAFDFRKTVYSVVETLAPMASKRGLSLNSHFENAKTLPYVKGDPLRVARVLMNLVGNAVKYTEQGYVNIIVDHHMLADDKAEIICSVVDTGVGIPADRLGAVFQKFTQADATTTRRFGGTGLGLTITKDLVELMGGTIAVTSVENEGSTFSFTVPFDIAETLEEKEEKELVDGVVCAVPSQRVHAGAAKILIAEDHVLNQSLIKKLLGRMGFQNLVVKDNGVLAVQAYKEGHFDMVLMDCHMPEMNGYEATEAIREAERGTGTRIPIISLTADAMVGTKDKCLAYGADDYVSKPIDADYFKELLGKWFILSNGDEPEGAQGAVSDEVIDLSNLNDYADTKEELVVFCTQLCRSTENDLNLLNSLCVEGECQEWVEAAHKVKGSAGIAGASRLQRLAMEAQALENSSAEKRRKYFDNMCIAYQEVKDAFNKQGLVEL